MKVFPDQRRLVIDHDPALARLIPGATPFQAGNTPMLAVPYELDAVRLLRNMGHEVPSPIQYYYEWAGGKPFDSQIVTADLLTVSPRAYVLSEMGVGKTRAALYAYDYLYGAGKCGRALVVAPLSTLVSVWENEIFENFPHLQAVVLHGDRAKRLSRLGGPADIYIINHDGVEVILSELLARRDIDVLLVDELAIYRNARSQRWKALAPVAKRAAFAWGLTGAPTPNEPTDAYGQVKLLTPERVSFSFTSFRDLTMKKVSNFRWVSRQDANDHVQTAMQPSVRFTRDQCFDLPETTYSDRMIKTDPRAAKAYKKMLDELVVEIKGEKIQAANEGVKLSKLLQIAAGFVYDESGEGQYVGGVDRFKEVFNLVEQAEGKLIVFAPFRFMVLALEQALSKRYPTAAIHGDTPPGKRAEIFSAFQREATPRIIVAHPATMAHGVTLTAASTIVWAAPITSLEIYEQANARITRAGQTKNTHIVHLMSSPVEKQVYSRLKRKSKMQGALLELFREASAFPEGAAQAA